MNKPTSIALVIVLFGSAGALYYWRSGNVNEVGAQRSFKTNLECIDCGHHYLAELDVTDRAPFECPKCGKKSGWFVWQCGKCKEHFVPKPEGNPPRQPMMPSCPKCKSSMTGRASLVQE